MITFWSIPREGGYQPTASLPNDLEGQNATYLWQPFIDAKKRYVQDFITALQTMSAPLDTIFAWEMENEGHFQTDQMPLSLTSGIVTTANGSSFDMSKPTDRQQMMDEGMGYYANQVTAAVKQVDPDHLVTMSFFSPVAPPPSYHWSTRTRWMILDPAQGGTNIDFVDLHLYLGLTSVADQMTAFEILPSKKPLILGEFGVPYPPTQNQYTTAAQAADALRSLQILSCSAAYRINGWITYTWDTTETANGQRDYYTALDGNGVIRDALAPALHPQPCSQ